MANRYEILEGFKAKVTLFSGGEVTLDMMKIQAREWRSLIDPKEGENIDEAEILGKAAGMTADAILALPQPDFMLLGHALIQVARQPLENPT